MSDAIQAGDPHEWQRPPDDELGVFVPLRIEFVRMDAVAFAAVGFVAYSTGFSFQLSLRKRIPVVPLEARGDMSLSSWLPPGLRFGIEFADGRRSFGFGSVPPWPREQPDVRTIVSLAWGGSGGAYDGRRWRSDIWVGPLPPPGPLSFLYVWPAEGKWPSEGIELTRHDIDPQPIIDAARRSEVLW